MPDATGWNALLDGEATDVLIAARRDALGRLARPDGAGARAAARLLTRVIRGRGVCPDCASTDHTDHTEETPA